MLFAGWSACVRPPDLPSITAVLVCPLHTALLCAPGRAPVSHAPGCPGRGWPTHCSAVVSSPTNWNWHS